MGSEHPRTNSGQDAIISLCARIEACSIRPRARIAKWLDANPIAAAANASLQDVVHAKLASDLAYVDRLSLVLQGGVVGDDEEIGEPRQLRNDILGNAVGKIVLSLVAARVVQGQHGDRRPVG